MPRFADPTRLPLLYSPVGLRHKHCGDGPSLEENGIRCHDGRLSLRPRRARVDILGLVDLENPSEVWILELLYYVVSFCVPNLEIMLRGPFWSLCILWHSRRPTRAPPTRAANSTLTHDRRAPIPLSTHPHPTRTHPPTESRVPTSLFGRTASAPSETASAPSAPRSSKSQTIRARVTGVGS